MFRTPLITFDPGYQTAADANRTPEEIASYGPHDLAGLVKRLGTPVLVGVDRVHYPIAGSGNSEAPPLGLQFDRACRSPTAKSSAPTTRCIA